MPSNTRLTRDEMLTLADKNEMAFKTMLRRGQWSGAFALSEAPARAWYSALDAVAMKVTAVLADTHGATLAAQLVRVFGHVLLRAIASAEADTGKAVSVAFVDLVGPDGRRAYAAHADTDAPTAAPTKAPTNGDFVTERVIAINVSQIVRVVRDRAAQLGLDLSGAFMPAPDSDAYTAIMSPYAELPACPVETRAIKKCESIARKASEKARAIAMAGGRVAVGNRKQATQAQAAAA